MSVCYIFAALETNDLPYIPSKTDYIIAADKGILNLQRLKLVPDLIIGDFDSLGTVPKYENVIRLPVEKDDTDVGYCLKYAMEKGFKEFVVYGAVGGLLDHTFANCQLSAYVSKRGGRAVFVGDGIYVTAITNDSIEIKNGGGRLSIFAIGETAKGVTYEGMKYSLSDADLSADFPLGVSNEIVESRAKISVKQGTLLIVSQSKL